MNAFSFLSFYLLKKKKKTTQVYDLKNKFII